MLVPITHLNCLGINYLIAHTHLLHKRIVPNDLCSHFGPDSTLKERASGEFFCRHLQHKISGRINYCNVMIGAVLPGQKKQLVVTVTVFFPRCCGELIIAI